MIHRIVASCYGQSALRSLGNYNLRLLLILQAKRRTLLTGQSKIVETYSHLAVSLQVKLSVITATRQAHSENMVFIFTFDVHVGTVHSNHNTILSRLGHFNRRPIITDGDILSMAHTTHHHGYHPQYQFLHFVSY